MQKQADVKVYGFRVYGSHVESPRVAGYKATREAILRMEGEVIAGTEEHVPPAELDTEGRYRRIATGWGELS